MQRDNVAPHAGAWIEIILKPHQRDAVQVAPHAGAWIEILSFDLFFCECASRTPCGCVD